MILNNKIPGLLPFDVRRKNNEVYFYYNITSKFALSQFLNRVRIKKEQLIDIMLQITRAMLSGMNFLLYNKCFIFHENYMFVNPATCEVYLVYLPIQVDADVNKALRDFIINMVIYSADISEDDGTENYICKILNYVKCETFNVADFNRLLVRLENEEAKGTTAEKNQGKGKHAGTGEEYHAMNDNGNVAKNLAYSGSDARNRCSKKGKRHGIAKGDFKTNFQSMMRKNCIAYAILAVLQVILVLLILSCGNFLRCLGGDIRTSYVAAGLIVVAVEVLAFKNLLWKLKAGGKNECRGAGADVYTGKGVCRSLTGVGIGSMAGDPGTCRSVDMNASTDENLAWNAGGNISEGMEEKYGSFVEDLYDLNNTRPDGLENENYSIQPTERRNCEHESKGGYSACTDVQGGQWGIDAGFGDNTVFLAVERNKKPFLRQEGDGFVEETLINKEDFLIGRLGGQVDYVVKNKAVGKIHAQVISRGGKYYIKDLNSKNGTYINHTRIDSNIEYEIKDGDRITFANSEHIFILK
ncbi:MAG: FHA domain-containing protein [Clostridiaceae bacterium]|nr:FHA domain-containing protein [Clostridiaceae bacterium]